MNDNQALETISELSREFGTATYVRGGGGNTSCKNADTLFIKPSGTTLVDMTPERFLALDRSVLEGLYSTTFPTDEKGREAAVVEFMSGTIRPGQTGRPSVEAPLHNIFPQRFVVHTHPAEVNGLTCGNDGEEWCKKLYPKALWVGFCEPGYTLCMRIREELAKYQEQHGRAAELVVMENHGIFIAHDEAEGIRNLFEQVMYGVQNRIAEAGLNSLPAKNPLPASERIDAVVTMLRDVIGDEASCHAVDGGFALTEGSLTPDHIVYHKVKFLEGEPTRNNLEAFKKQYGYWPRIVATSDAVFGLGSTQKVADLALELAWDGSIVMHYADAFGGVHYLERRFVDFIENWEVESYRQKMVK